MAVQIESKRGSVYPDILIALHKETHASTGPVTYRNIRTMPIRECKTDYYWISADSVPIVPSDFYASILYPTLVKMAQNPTLDYLDTITAPLTPTIRVYNPNIEAARNSLVHGILTTNIPGLTVQPKPVTSPLISIDYPKLYLFNITWLTTL